MNRILTLLALVALTLTSCSPKVPLPSNNDVMNDKISDIKSKSEENQKQMDKFNSLRNDSIKEILILVRSEKITIEEFRQIASNNQNPQNAISKTWSDWKSYEKSISALSRQNDRLNKTLQELNQLQVNLIHSGEANNAYVRGNNPKIEEQADDVQNAQNEPFGNPDDIDIFNRMINEVEVIINQQQANECYIQAAKLNRENRFNEALEAINRAVTLYPSNVKLVLIRLLLSREIKRSGAEGNSHIFISLYMKMGSS